MPAGKLVKKGSAANSVYQMGPGLKMDHGAKQIGNPGLHKKYGMHQESAKTQRADDLKYMPVDDRAGTKQYMKGAKQMKTGIYQDRMNGKLPENPALKQYGMDKDAVKQVGKHMAAPQMEGLKKKVAGNPIDKIKNFIGNLGKGKKDKIPSNPYDAEQMLYGTRGPGPDAFVTHEEEKRGGKGMRRRSGQKINIKPIAGKQD